MTFLLSMLVLLACNTSKKIPTNPPKSIVVKSVDDFRSACEKAMPGDTIVLANGVWKDAELQFALNGTSESPIVILAEEKGKVFFEGQSYVKMGGSHLQLEGLVFRNGFTPTSSVISFQQNKTTSCNNCRVTECVIDNYNPSERFDTDYWVEIYGKNNTFDHNYLVAKRNRGVTLAVRLKDESDRENNHIISHNYFGYRPLLGSNGGETLRVGTSHYSLSNSNTVVENNYFERCGGELEIISSKSCQNTFRNNCFYECQGTLTMRHGNETLVENNYFFGNRRPNTGGIRVINETQTVRNNYMEGLTGSRFKGSLVVMNGVPNSPLNRYFQVKDSDVSNNIIKDCDHIQLCAGSDEERSATPINTSFRNNLFLHESADKIFTIYDDVSGIDFNKNVLGSNLDFPNDGNSNIERGFEKRKVALKKGEYNYKNGNDVVGPNTKTPMPSASNTGVSWYPKKDYLINFRSGKTIKVAPGENTIFEAMKDAEEGDILELTGGDYHMTRTVFVDKTVTIRAKEGIEKPVVTFERSPLLSIENEGSLELENIRVSGKESADYSGNAVVRTSRYSMINNYKFFVRSCEIEDLDVNHSFNFLKVYKNTFADSIIIENTNFTNITGHVMNMDKEIDDIGIYNVEDVVINNCKFKDIGGSAMKLYRGGRDESTFGPRVWLSNTDLENVGHDKRNKNDSALHIHGVQHAEFDNLNIINSKKIHMHLVVGEPVIKLNNLKLVNSEEIYSNSTEYSSSNITVEGNE